MACPLQVPHGSLQDSGMVAAAAYSLLAAELGHNRSRSGGGGGSSSSSSGSCSGSGSTPGSSGGRHQHLHEGQSAGANTATSPASSSPLRLLLLGTNHFSSRPLACLSSAAAWATPLGQVPTDRQLSSVLAAAGLPFDDAPHK